MHPTLLPRPFHHEGWVYEEKIDGYRMAAVKAVGAVQLISRQGRDHTKRFPELVKALGRLHARTFVLDGEVAVFDKDLVSRFEWLRGRPTDERATSPVYIAFDVLEVNGRDLRPKTLRERRRVLERLSNHHSMIFPARRLSADGFKAWEEVLSRGYEGIVAKDPDSPYVAGRTLKWLKVKQPKYRELERGFYKPLRSLGRSNWVDFTGYAMPAPQSPAIHTRSSSTPPSSSPQRRCSEGGRSTREHSVAIAVDGEPKGRRVAGIARVTDKSAPDASSLDPAGKQV